MEKIQVVWREVESLGFCPFDSSTIFSLNSNPQEKDLLGTKGFHRTDMKQQAFGQPHQTLPKAESSDQLTIFLVSPCMCWAFFSLQTISSSG
jgi:hypothetical protein